MKQSRKDHMVSEAINIAEDPSHGYSQTPPSGRWGPDYDCSSLIYKIANDAGYPVGIGGDDHARWTGTMAKDFKDAGFQLLPFANVGIDGLEIGDILLNLAVHAEIYVGDGQVVGAQGSETGGYSGQSGDQTGTEITIQPVYTHSHGWNYVLRPPLDEDGSDDEGANKMPIPGYYPQSTAQQGWVGRQQQGYSQGMGYPQMGSQYNGYSTPQGYYPQGYNRQMPQLNQGYQQGNYMAQPQGYMQGGQQQGVKTVMGVEEVMNYPQENGTLDAYFDVHKDIFYFKCVDANGVPSVKVCEFHEIEDPGPQHGGNTLGKMMGNTTGHQVSREEFEQLKEMMMHGQSGFMGQQGMEPASDGPAQSNGNAQSNQRTGRSS